MVLETQMGGGTLNLKIHPWGLLSILSMFQSLQSISFQQIALCFQNFTILSNYRPLTTLILFYVSIHRIAFVTFVEAKCEYINLARAKSEASISLLMIKAIKFKSNNMNSKSRKEIFKVFICLSIFVSSANITTKCGQEPQAGW